jgi:hypothetical protein
MSKFNQIVLKLAQQNPAFRQALVSDLKTADKWETLPKGWTDESRKEFWESLTSGSPKHKVTACIKKMEGKMDNPGAFCASLADRVTPGWRDKKGAKAPTLKGIRNQLKNLLAVLGGADDYLYEGATKAGTAKALGVVATSERLLEGLRKSLEESTKEDKGKKASDSEWMTLEEVRTLCPSCADKMASRGIKKIKTAVLRVAMQQR